MYIICVEKKCYDGKMIDVEKKKQKESHEVEEFEELF